MQSWLYLCKLAPRAAGFALVSLALGACSTTPQHTGASLKTVKTVPASAIVKAERAVQPAGAPEDYYDTTGAVQSQDDIDELLGVTEMEAARLSPEDLAKFGDVWERVRAGFKMKDADNERISVQRSWFAKRQDYLDRMTARASHYLYHTVTEAERMGVPTELALLPVIESSYDPFATSPAQAAGMWQFIPGTGKIFGLRQTWWYDGRRDVLESTRAAYKFLSQLYNKFGSWELALAAYNAGPGTIQRAIERNEAAGLPTDYWSLQLPAETMAYVPRFLAVVQVVKNPSAFGVALQPIVNQPHFRETYARNQVDLAEAARLAGLTPKQLYQLNPGYMRWATNPDGPHRLLVPASTAESFEEQLATLAAPERFVMVQKRYKVRRGDTLYRIAARFGTTPAALKNLNGKLVSKRGKVPVGSLLVVARVRTQVSGEMVESDQIVNPAVQHLAQLEKSPSTADGKKVASKDNARKDKDEDDGDKAYHKVRAGDTLFSIAKKYGVSAKELAAWNDMRPRDSLRRGVKLVVYTDDGARSSSRVAKARAGARDKDVAQDSRKPAKDTKDRKVAKSERKGAKDNVKRISYEVKRGDTLYSISQRYNVSISQIRTWNKASKTLKPGQDLVLYLARI